MAVTESVELELGFENGGLLRCSVGATDAVEIVQAYREVRGRLIPIDTEKGRVVVDLRRVAYIRELEQRHSIGFGMPGM
jgi:hypothetical protein